MKKQAFAIRALVAGLPLLLLLPATTTGGAMVAIAEAPEDRGPQLEKVVFVDYGSEGGSREDDKDRGKEAHSGPSSTADGCGDGSAQYVLIAGGIKWSRFPVPYFIDASSSKIDPTAAKNAVIAAFNTWDSQEHPAGQLFTQTSSPASAKIKVRWGYIDGLGNVLGRTTFWYSPSTKTITSAEIVFDSGDRWFVASKQSCSGVAGSPFDIENVAVHEIGHALGLGHPGDRLLSMYGSSAQGETLKRSLGVGDKAGLDRLY